MVDNTSCKRIGRFLVVLGIGVTASCGLRTIQQMPPVAVAAFVPPKFHPGTVSEAAWSDGTKLKVLCLAGESLKAPGWKIDGSPARVTDFVGPNAEYLLPARGKKRPVVVIFSLTGKRIEAAIASQAMPLIAVRLGGDNKFIIGGAEWNREGTIPKVERGWEVPEGIANADFEAGLGFGDYKPVLVWPATPKKLEVVVLEEAVNPYKISGKASGSGTKATTPLPACKVECQVPSSLLHGDWRISLYRADGSAIPTTVEGFASAFFPRLTHTKVRAWASVAPEEVKKVVVETRDFRWIKIPGLPMIPKS